MTVTTALATEIQKLAPSAIIELFELDTTAIGGDLYYFHAGTNQLHQNIIWQGQTYVRFPIKVSGFEFTGQGQFPRPKLQVSNILSAITTLLIQYNDLLGAKITRRRTMAKFLDAANFTGGVNASADPTAEFAQDIYYIDRKSSEDRDTVEFELAASADLMGVAIPRRQVIQNVCVWRYRGSECGFTGAPIIDVNDAVITSTSSALGNALLSAYQTLVAAQATLATDEAALSAATQAMGSACDYGLIQTAYNYSGGITGTDVVINFADGTQISKFGGVDVTLGLVYRRGTARVVGTWQVYEIEKWAIDTAACSTATTTYNSALASRDAAQTAVTSAQSAYDSALAALPSNDPLYASETCGKRLSSCKARFGETSELPFGSFPASGLT